MWVVINVKQISAQTKPLNADYLSRLSVGNHSDNSNLSWFDVDMLFWEVLKLFNNKHNNPLCFGPATVCWDSFIAFYFFPKHEGY